MTDYEPKWNSSDSDMPSGMDSQAENYWRYQRDFQRDMVNSAGSFEWGTKSSNGSSYSSGSGSNADLTAGIGSLIGLLFRGVALLFLASLFCALALAAFLMDGYLILHGLTPWE
ncbi:MAG: hypothetical protein JNL43_00400 [Flavobacteriales bacterium]|nr:hypothetical protein [Flavobacteriales bacterium]